MNAIAGETVHPNSIPAGFASFEGTAHPQFLFINLQSQLFSLRTSQNRWSNSNNTPTNNPLFRVVREPPITLLAYCRSQQMHSVKCKCHQVIEQPNPTLVPFKG